MKMNQYQNLKQAVSLLNKGTPMNITKTEHSQSLLDVYNDYLFLWNQLDSSVVAISLREHEFEKVHLVPTDTPFFQVDQLLISPSGKWICISGKRGTYHIWKKIFFRVARDFNHSYRKKFMFLIYVFHYLCRCHCDGNASSCRETWAIHGEFQQ